VVAKPKTMADLTPDPANPREITKEAAEGLRLSLSEFGDISGIVWNERTGHLVAGHQRLDQLRELYGDLKIEGGEIVTPEGERFRVRIVDWDLSTQHAANVAANSELLSGTFTADLTGILEGLKDEDPDLFESLRFEGLAQLAPTPEEEEPPEEFPEYDEDIQTEYECPKCGYKWSGKAKQNVETG